MTDDNLTKSIEEIAKEQKHYAVHLSEVNQTQNVTATEDIFPMESHPEPCDPRVSSAEETVRNPFGRGESRHGAS
jgi:hypothetical protein